MSCKEDAGSSAGALGRCRLRLERRRRMARSSFLLSLLDPAEQIKNEVRGAKKKRMELQYDE